MSQKKTYTHYYLRINNSDIIDLTCIPGLEDMDDYLKLNFFTGAFTSREELIKALKGMGAIPQDLIVSDISIVRRKGNKKDGYHYEYITSNLTFKKDLKFMSIAAIKKFLLENRDNSEMIAEIADYYRDNIEKLISFKEENLSYLKRSINNLPPGEEKDAARDEYDKVSRTLKKFNREQCVIYDIIALASAQKHRSLSHEEELAYIDALYSFVTSEVTYYHNRKRTPNNRGLVKLAKLISRMCGEYVVRDSFLYEQESDYSKVITANSSTKRFDENDDVDPDTYMFLENEDFRRLANENTPSEILAAIEEDIETLEEKKSGTKRF